MRLNGKEGTKYSLKDISIKSAQVSDIKDVSECIPFDNFGKLPIFTLPNDAIVNDSNYKTFTDNNIKVIIPKTVDIEKRLELVKQDIWVAFTITEFEKYFTGEEHLEVIENKKYYVLIDTDNGNSNAAFEIIMEANKIFNDKICTMVNNITNPETYRTVFDSDINYICISEKHPSMDCGIDYPIASLLEETLEVREDIRKTGVCGCRLPKIVVYADIETFSDIVKLLAIGAEHVMVDKPLLKTLESNSPKNINWEDGVIGGTFGDIYKRLGIWYGVYSEEYVNEQNKELDDEHKLQVGEVPIGKITTKGVNGEELDVDYTVVKWSETLKDNIRLAMAATNTRNMFEFNRNTQLVTLK